MDPTRDDRRARVLALYDNEHASLVRLARLLVGDPEAAEDLVQDAFVRLYRARPALREPHAASAYLRTTVVRRARRRGRRRPATPSDDRILDALGRLPARERECIVLRHYAQMPEPEIAAAVDCSVVSVHAHVRQGLSALPWLMSGQEQKAWQ